MERLLDADEWALAFETFCTQLYEHRVVLPDRTYNHFHGLAHRLNVDRRVVWLLRNNAKQLTSELPYRSGTAASND